MSNDRLDELGGNYTSQFQSLGRDSVLSNVLLAAQLGRDAEVSIPRSGFCFVEQKFRRPQDRKNQVSIPRSGFCFVEQGVLPYLYVHLIQFQSLGRDSVLSNNARPHRSSSPPAVFQSLGRDSVLSNYCYHCSLLFLNLVSIPRSGFCFVEHFLIILEV